MPVACVVGLAFVAWLYGRGLRALWRAAGRGHGVGSWQAAAFAAGWLALAVALVSPLHELGEVYFAAHMVQHELLMVVAAPLLVLGRPLVATVWAIPMRSRRALGRWTRARRVRAGWRWLTSPLVAWSLQALVLCGWHAPPLYQRALRSEPLHAVQHLCFLFTALLFWWAVLPGRRRMGSGAAIFYVFSTALYSGVLGALLTFAPTLWYPAYAGTRAVGALTPLEDQQLAGLIMWIPAGACYLLAALALAASWLRESEWRVVQRERGVVRAAIGGG